MMWPRLTAGSTQGGLTAGAAVAGGGEVAAQTQGGGALLPRGRAQHTHLLIQHQVPGLNIHGGPVKVDS